jgi:Ca2+-binding EF-hand superfamily protein
MEHVTQTWNFLLDRTPGQLINALMIALTLALLGAGLHALGRRKVQDTTMLTVGVLLFAILTSMTLAASVAADLLDSGANPRRILRDRRAGGSGSELALGPLVLRGADSDGDGRIASDEVADAVAKFVREADPDEDGSIDARAVWKAAFPPMPPGGFTPPRRHFPAAPREFGETGNRFMADRLVDLIDADGDGTLTADEAAEFVRRVAEDDEPIDAGDLAHALRDRQKEAAHADFAPRS